MNTAIQLESVSCNYGDTVVLDKINITISQSEIMSIVGPSGCGKTTLLNSIAGFHTEYTGNINVNGFVGYIFQSGNLFPWMSVKDNILIGSQNKYNSVLVSKIIAMSGIEHHLEKYPHELSGGQRQRVAIARAFLSDNDIILMDEPFSGLDMLSRRSMQQWLCDICAETRKTVVLVTHDIREAIVVSDRVLVMHEYVITEFNTRDIKFSDDTFLFEREMEKILNS